METLRRMHASLPRKTDRVRRTLASHRMLLLITGTLVGTYACAPHYVPFAPDTVRLMGAVAAPGEGVGVGLGVGPTWVELNVRNEGTSTVWVSIDGVTVTGPDGREHGMVESSVLNAIESELAAVRYSSRMTSDHFVSRFAGFSPAAGEPREVGDRTASIEPGKSVQLLLHPIEYLRRDGTGLSPFPDPFWGGFGEEEGELRVVLPMSWGRTWGRLEILGRVGG